MTERPPGSVPGIPTSRVFSEHAEGLAASLGLALSAVQSAQCTPVILAPWKGPSSSSRSSRILLRAIRGYLVSQSQPELQENVFQISKPILGNNNKSLPRLTRDIKITFPVEPTNSVSPRATVERPALYH